MCVCVRLHGAQIDDWLNDEPIKETFRCPDLGGPLFPHRSECQKFYTCSSEGLALTHTCPNGGFFDHKYMFCGQRSDVTCYTVIGVCSCVCACLCVCVLDKLFI